MTKRKEHPGFAASSRKIARKEGIPLANADAIMADASRRASPAAKRANPNLERVADHPHSRKHRKSSHDTNAPMDTGSGLKKRRRRCKSCGSLPKRGRTLKSGGGDTDDELDTFIGKERYMGIPREQAKEAIRRKRASDAEKRNAPKRTYTRDEIQRQVDAAKRGWERHHPGQPFNEAYVRSQFPLRTYVDYSVRGGPKTTF